MYDAKLHRFLAPDNYVQDPANSQNYNRYEYALNNPLKYTDPSGEFLVGLVSVFFKGIFQGAPPFKTALKTGVNEMKIAFGRFKTDPNKTFGGQVWEVFSRLTWQSPQTALGDLVANISNTFWQVDNVDYKYGATVISGNNWGSGDAVTLGHYILGDGDLVADPNNPLFQHEYGHYLQSQEMGLGYLARVGVPSMFSGDPYDFHHVEQDANRRAFKYLNKEVSGFYKSFEQRNENRGWNFFENPLNINGTDQRSQYVDYYNPVHMGLLNNLSIRSKLGDYFGTVLIPVVLHHFVDIKYNYFSFYFSIS